MITFAGSCRIRSPSTTGWAGARWIPSVQLWVQYGWGVDSTGYVQQTAPCTWEWGSGSGWASRPAGGWCSQLRDLTKVRPIRSQWSLKWNSTSFSLLFARQHRNPKFMVDLLSYYYCSSYICCIYFMIFKFLFYIWLEGNWIHCIVRRCRLTIDNLKKVWEAVRVLGEEQNEWKCHRWHKINTNQLRTATEKQLDSLKKLPEEVLIWDVYHGLQDSILDIQVCRWTS